MSKYPASAVASGALFETGSLASQQRQFDAAILSFAAVQEKYPAADEAPESAYQQGLALRYLNQLAAAVKQWEKAIARYPKSTAADRSRLSLGWEEHHAGHFDNASSFFRTVMSTRSDELAAEAQYGIGVSLQSAGKEREAIIAYMRVKYVFPAAGVWIAKASFGLGECYENTQQTQKAKDAYQFVAKQTYVPDMAVIAQERLKKLDRL